MLPLMFKWGCFLKPVPQKLQCISTDICRGHVSSVLWQSCFEEEADDKKRDSRDTSILQNLWSFTEFVFIRHQRWAGLILFVSLLVVLLFISTVPILASKSRSISSRRRIYCACKRQVSSCWDAVTDILTVISWFKSFISLPKKKIHPHCQFVQVFVHYSHIRRDAMLTLSSSFSFPLEQLCKRAERQSSV